MPRQPAPPIEVRAPKRSERRLGMTPQAFLRDYWQKRPLLIRGAYPGFVSPVEPNDLAGVATEETALSRIVTRVRHKSGERWLLRSGPFAEGDFATLPRRGWTLLVQDCDKWFDEVARLRDAFDFVPRWRVDDVMISYAVDGGSVGPHLDQYDVFLLQATGTRRWQISADPGAPRAFRPNTQLKLLQEFSPTHDWLLEPGDMLYLPPGVPHHGVGVGECTTWSIGMRAPSVAELLADFAGHVAESLGDEWRYSDPDLRVPADPSEIDDRALAAVARVLADAARADATDARLRDWFGRFITSYRSAHVPLRRGRRVDAATLRARVAQGHALMRSPWSRYAWRRDGRGAIAYVAGDAYRASLALARLLGAAATLDGAAARACSQADWETLADLVNAGHYALVRGHRGGTTP